MHIVLFCATRRGYLFLKRLRELLPQSELTVFSFKETAWEPPFLDDIRRLALSSGARFIQARQVGSKTHDSFWDSSAVHLMFAVNWRYLIPPRIYQRAQAGAFVFHDSLLPHYRGFSPTVWSMINGEDHTGVSLFEISDQVDFGDIVDQQRILIGPDEPIASVIERVTESYLGLLERNVELLIQGKAPRFPQDHRQATYTCKRIPEDNWIDWADSTQNIYNLIRAVSAPYPGAHTRLSGKVLRVWAAQKVSEPHVYVGRIPGRVIEIRPKEGSMVLTGDGMLLLTEVQLEGGVVQCASEVLNSTSQTLGTDLQE